MIHLSIPRPRVALILGVDGPLGYYLARLLLAKGYVVHGVARPAGRSGAKGAGAGGKGEAGSASGLSGSAAADDIPPCLRGLADHPLFSLHESYLDDRKSIPALIDAVRPDELYNLTGEGRPNIPGRIGDFDAPNYALAHFWAATGVHNSKPKCRILLAVTHEIFGDATAPAGGWAEHSPQPPIPHPHSQANAWELAGASRRDGLYVARAILFPHASPMQSPDAWPRTLTRAAAGYHINGFRIPLASGEGRLFGDMGHTAEFAEACWRTLQQPAGGDWVIAQNNGYESDALAIVEGRLKLPRKDWTKPAGTATTKMPQPPLLGPLAARRGDSRKALRELRWSAGRTDREVLEEMLEVDLRRALLCKGPLDEVEELWVPEAWRAEEAGGEPAGGGKSEVARAVKSAIAKAKATQKASRRK